MGKLWNWFRDSQSLARRARDPFRPLERGVRRRGYLPTDEDLGYQDGFSFQAEARSSMLSPEEKARSAKKAARLQAEGSAQYQTAFQEGRKGFRNQVREGKIMP
jgi:hypothetical protein